MTGAPRWHALSSQETLARQGTSPAGLEPEEAARRLADHGANELRQEAPVRPVTLLLEQFRSLLVVLLLAAAGVSGVVGEWADAIAILAIVVLNAAIGFYQEYSAERSLAALRRMTAPRARVRRGGKSLTVPAAALVPGDVVEMEAGDVVPADARLLEAVALTTVEAPLTGESEPAGKDPARLDGEDTPLAERRNMVFMGTSVGAGRAVAVVTGTGMGTEIGRIAGMLEDAAGDATTPLQSRLQAFGRVLVWGALGIVALVFLLGVFRGIDVFELLLTSVSLAVAAVPEGLPAVVTIALSVGVWRMAKRRALVRRLPAVETLGSADVICTDKTGTLTVGEMTVRRLETAHHAFDVSGEGYAPEGAILADGAEPARDELRELLTVFAGCNDAHLVHADGAWRVLGDPTEGALLAAAGKGGIRRELLEAETPRVGEVPFDSDRKRMTVVRRRGEARRALVKGAPEELLARCTALLGPDGVLPMRDADRDRILERSAAMAKGALRVLAAAYRDLGPGETLDAERLERDLVFAGL
ncbi:MAG: HAD-IC family P-type ATPase, partial [Planctomycetes bacterium]|nr:HAD-IC family P-type ATPase [Planctomycetota bacterium]